MFFRTIHPSCPNSLGGRPCVLVWLPGQDSGQHHYTPVVDPRTGRLLCIPALVLPQAA